MAETGVKAIAQGVESRRVATLRKGEKVEETPIVQPYREGKLVKLKSGETLLELKPFTITSTVKLEATDTRAAILKASQLLASAVNGTIYEFEELSVKVEQYGPKGQRRTAEGDVQPQDYHENNL